MRNLLARGAAFVLLVTLLVPAGIGRGAEPGEQPNSVVEPVRQQQLELLQSRVEQLSIEVANEPPTDLKRGAQPILRWSNPVRDFVNDGVTYLYLHGERPQVVVSIRARSREAGLERGELWREFVSLSSDPLVCRRDERAIWSPTTGGVVDRPLADAPPPAAKPVQRLAQLRQQARRFQAASLKMKSRNELRLLPQPLYRYQDKAAGIVDGGLFAFAEGNDPEALLLLEMLKEDGGKEPRWRYTLARMTTYPVVVQLDDRQVFEVESYWDTRRTPEDPYVEVGDGPFTLPDAEDKPDGDE